MATVTLNVSVNQYTTGDISTAFSGSASVTIGTAQPVTGSGTATTTAVLIDIGTLTGIAMVVITNTSDTYPLSVGFAEGGGNVTNGMSIPVGASAVLYPPATSIYVDGVGGSATYEYIAYPSAA